MNAIKCQKRYKCHKLSTKLNDKNDTLTKGNITLKDRLPNRFHFHGMQMNCIKKFLIEKV